LTPQLRGAFAQGLRADALEELAAARVALLRTPAAFAAIVAATDSAAADTWPAGWCAVAPACAALAAMLRSDAAAVAALGAAAFAHPEDTAAPGVHAAAVATLGALLHASAVRALFPVCIACGADRAADAPPPWLPPLHAAFDGAEAYNACLLSLPAALGGLICLATCNAEGNVGEADAASSAAADALVSLAASHLGDAIVSSMSGEHMRALAAPLLRDDGTGEADNWARRVSARASAICAALTDAGESGIAALCRSWVGTNDAAAPGAACALAAVALDIVQACRSSSGDAGCRAAAALCRHAVTLNAAAQHDDAVRDVLLPAGLVAALSSAHANASTDAAPAIGAVLASLAWTPRGVASVCSTPGGAAAAASALTALAASQLAAAAADGERLPGTAAWRHARYVSSSLGAHPLGAAALHAAGWNAALYVASGASDDGLATDGPAADLLFDGTSHAPSAAALSAAFTAVEALLAASDPGCLVAFRRDGSAPAALLSRWLRRDFHDAATWRDADGYAALAARDDRGYAALVAYPAALLLGPLRGVAMLVISAEGDASGGAGMLPARLCAAAHDAGFTAAGAEEALLQLSAHAAVAERFWHDVGDI
jgi:hypothetical protein